MVSYRSFILTHRNQVSADKRQRCGFSVSLKITLFQNGSV